MSEIGIGTRLWKFDENRRVYRKRHGSPVFSEHFTPGVVTGETKGTWSVGHNSGAGRTVRVNKRTLREPANGDYSGHQWFTDAGRDDAVWAHERRREIVRLVDTCDVPTLRQIATLLNVETKEPEL